MGKKYLFFVLTFLLWTGLTTNSFSMVSGTLENGDGQWTIESIYPVNSHASGLAWDGEYIYIGSYGGNQGQFIYRFDPSAGTNELYVTAPIGQSFGLTWDGEFLWSIDRGSASLPAWAHKINDQGEIVGQFDLPDTYMSGIAYDQGDFWVATYYPDPGTIYHLTEGGNDEWEEVSSFTPPTDQPWDVARHDTVIWIADYNASQLHKLQLDGTLIATYPGSNYRTSGVVHDGTYLWYVSRESNGDSFLYKVNLGGSGTPDISVPTAFDFGNVTINNTGTWNMVVQNTGDGQLVLEDMSFPDDVPFSVDETFPIEIAPGESFAIEVTFAPTVLGEYEITAILHSNDPSDPATSITLNGTGLESGPWLYTDQDQIDFGVVRFNSSSKEYLFLKNMGDETLEISSIDLSADYFWFGYQVEFPITLAPVESVELPLWFQPEITGEIDAEASVVFNGMQSPVTIPLAGISEEQNFDIGDLIWEYQVPGTSTQARAIMNIPDLNEDGFQDVLVGSRDNYIRAYNGASSNEADIIWETLLGVVEYPKAMALGSDINDDGMPDIFVGTAYGDRAVTALSSVTGEVLWRFETNLYGMGGWVYMIDVKYDYNGNGFMDVLAATGDDTQGAGPKRVFCLDGETGDIIWQTPLNGAGFAVLAVEDFTDDGIPDVIAGASSAANEGKVFGINGANGNIEWEFTTAGSSVWALEQLSDITGNGIPDVIAGAFGGMYYLMDVTNGNVEHSASLGNSSIVDFWAAGDLNNDGFTDIVPGYSSVLNAVAISGQDGQLIWSTPLADQSWNVAILRDITGDGINEIAIGTLFNNNFVYFLDGSDGTILKEVAMPAAVDAMGYVPDVDGNGTVEVIAGARNGWLAALSGGPSGDPILYNVTFEVKDEAGNPLEDANIYVPAEDVNLVTDAAGIATIELFAGTYPFTVTKAGYAPESSFFVVVDEDITVEVELESTDLEYTVTFIVTSNETPAAPVTNAAIAIEPGAVVVYTDQNGLASVNLVAGDYDYTAEAEGFFPYTGDFVVVDENIALEITMDVDDTHAGSLINPYLAEAFCYPNPFTEYTHIVFSLVQDSPVTLTFYDSRGRIVYTAENMMYPAGKNEYRWRGQGHDGSILKEGMYFYEIKIKNNVYRNRLIIARD